VLLEFLESKRSDVIARARIKVAARSAPPVTGAELAHGVPLLVDRLLETLKDLPGPDNSYSAATKHGTDLLGTGLTIGQVIHDYGHLGQAVTELAFEQNARISVDEFHRLNRYLDNAITEAVTEYARIRRQSNAAETERLVAAAILSSTDVGGERTVRRLNALLERSLAEVSLEAVVGSSATILHAEFVEAVAFAAAKETT
jgi:hypothetical protein